MYHWPLSRFVWQHISFNPNDIHKLDFDFAWLARAISSDIRPAFN
jgi:hypothetical protein